MSTRGENVDLISLLRECIALSFFNLRKRGALASKIILRLDERRGDVAAQRAKHKNDEDSREMHRKTPPGRRTR